jgi:phage terminase Nu1 subunit (DNA packaging protein)
MPPPLLPEKADDWLYIQAQFELAEKSVPTLSKETGVPVQRIFAVAHRNGWLRAQDADVAAQQRAELRLARESQDEIALQEEKARLIEVNVQMQANMLHTHRQDIGMARTISMQLFQELQGMMTNQDLLADLGRRMRNENDRGVDKENDLYQYVIGFNGRVDSVKKLTDAMKNLLLLERQAYGVTTALNDPTTPQQVATPTEDAMDAILKRFDVVMTSKDSPPIAEVIENGATR